MTNNEQNTPTTSEHEEDFLEEKEVVDICIPNVNCPLCKSEVNINMCRSVIKISQTSVRFYCVCPSCNINVNYSKNDYKQILFSPSKRDLWSSITNSIITKTIEKSNTEVIRSSKNIFVAAILACFFGLIGAQNLYMGHMKKFLVNIALFLLSISIFALGVIVIKIGLIPLSLIPIFILLTALLSSVNLYWGLFDCIRILFGKAKDSKGAYLLTNAQHKKRLQFNAMLNSNKR